MSRHSGRKLDVTVKSQRRPVNDSNLSLPVWYFTAYKPLFWFHAKHSRLCCKCSGWNLKRPLKDFTLIPSSDFFLRQKSGPSLRRRRDCGSSTRKTFRITSTSRGDAKAPNQDRWTVEAGWSTTSSSTSTSVAFTRQNREGPGCPSQERHTITTIRTGQVRSLKLDI